ncbi:cytosolic prostaglandin E synthase isoform X2 [Oratosquilla oratoria]|uniref:cytosolic prostaglandin E synthase isoform X2 n=1 Tax=Oratosquilla oratoria TaxID=337810 RepID=UPI003F76A253
MVPSTIIEIEQYMEALVYIPPPVTWAQRKNVIFLTFCVEDISQPDIKIETNKVYFKGTGGAEKKNYENTLELYGEVDTEKSKYCVRDRNVEMILVKKEEGPYWPHLLKQKVKQHWLKVDFSKWKDEDDSDDEGGNSQDLEEMMRQMGGLGGAGDGDRPSLDDLDDDDSDDDDLPGLE